MRATITLARIFGLLSGMSVIPESVTCTAVDLDRIDTSIRFEISNSTAADMCTRKIRQLTETIDVSMGRLDSSIT